MRFCLRTTNHLSIGPSIIAGFGFTTAQSTLMSITPGAAALASLGLSFLIAKYTNRTTAGISILTLPAVGCAMILGIPSSNSGARYGGYVLTLQCELQSCLTKILGVLIS